MAASAILFRKLMPCGRRIYIRPDDLITFRCKVITDDSEKDICFHTDHSKHSACGSSIFHEFASPMLSGKTRKGDVEELRARICFFEGLGVIDDLAPFGQFGSVTQNRLFIERDYHVHSLPGRHCRLVRKTYLKKIVAAPYSGFVILVRKNMIS